MVTFPKKQHENAKINIGNQLLKVTYFKFYDNSFITLTCSFASLVMPS